MLKKFAVVGFAVTLAFTAEAAPRARAKLAVAPEWSNARQMSGAELARKISGPPQTRPVVLQVGYSSLYETAHIPGAVFAGPASTSDGLAILKRLAAKIPRNKEVILYCGCCPWDKCPNIHPAYDALRRMGFSRLVILLVPQNFAHDWIGQGFPVVRGK